MLLANILHKLVVPQREPPRIWCVLPLHAGAQSVLSGPSHLSIIRAARGAPSFTSVAHRILKVVTVVTLEQLSHKGRTYHAGVARLSSAMLLRRTNRHAVPLLPAALLAEEGGGLQHRTGRLQRCRKVGARSSGLPFDGGHVLTAKKPVRGVLRAA